MKKMISMMLCLALLTSVLVTGAAAAGLGNFQKTGTYTGVFTDVPQDSWFYQNVAGSYEYGLIRGISDTLFAPGENVRLSEAIAMASRLHSIYHTGSDAFLQGSPWYQVYVDYAVSNGIITASQYMDYTAFATRAQFAQIFAKALPDDALSGMNTITDGSIPDVSKDAVFIYKLFRAGVMTGKTETGMFYPDDNIQRSEAAAVVTRMAVPSLRVSFSITDPKADLKAKLLLAKEAVSITIKSFATAKACYEGLSTSTDPLTIAAYANAMYKALEKALEYSQYSVRYINDATSLCADKVEFEEIQKHLKTASMGCTNGAKCIAAATAEPAAADWNLTEAYLNAGADALAKALKAMG